MKMLAAVLRETGSKRPYATSKPVQIEEVELAPPQAGELMTMMGTSMSDEEFEQLTNVLLEHEQKLIDENPELKKEGKRIVTKSWIEAAKNNRKAILGRIKEEW